MAQSILHILGTGELEGTSIARTVTLLASCIDPSLYRMHAWFLGGDGPLIDTLRSSGVQADPVLWSSGIRDPAGMLRFWRALRRERFAIVHQHFGGRSVRWVVRRTQRSRIVVHLHGRVNEMRGVLSARAPMAGADAVIAVSHAVSAQVPGARTTIVYPGIELAVGTPGVSTLPGREAGVVIGTASRLVPIKGLLYLLDGFARLIARRPGVRLEIAGTGTQRPELERLARDLGIVGAVSFLGWQRNISRVMARWDIYAQSSLDEGFGMAVLDAMAAGLPVVATGVGGIPELVRSGQTGLLVPPRDPEGLARSLERLVEDANLRRQMGQAGCRRAHECFGGRRMAEEIAAIYSKLLAPPPLGA